MLWKVRLQHEDTGRTTERLVESDGKEKARRRAEELCGPRWFSYSAEVNGEKSVAEGE